MTLRLLLLAEVVTIGLLVWAAAYARRLRIRHGHRGLFRRYPIGEVQLDAVSPRFLMTGAGPTRDAEVVFVGHGLMKVLGATTDTEAWVLSVLARDATEMFEFGTCTGRTTYLWARNSDPEAKVTTLTLAPGQEGSYAAAPGDRGLENRVALREIHAGPFLYEGTDVAAKVTQLYGDSKAFDEGPYVGRCDLIFVDGSHAASYVRSDTEKALRMLRPGGLLLWHDYSPHVPGVFDTLTDLARRLPLMHLGGTTLVAYRAPA
jgi:predicted O-methyltransferase YrrM